MILGIIQARMSSSRFPGKVLKPLFGIPMLQVMAIRALDSRKIDLIMIATSSDKIDNPIRELCRKNRFHCYSGAHFDVLDRFYWASQVFWPDHIVRLTGDCPLIDSEIVDQVIDMHISGKFDYTRNMGFADGLDVEVMTFEALCKAWSDAGTKYEREHVTPYFYNHPEIFKIGELRNEIDQSKMKISIDTEEDYLKIKRFLEIILWEEEKSEGRIQLKTKMQTPD